MKGLKGVKRCGGVEWENKDYETQMRVIQPFVEYLMKLIWNDLTEIKMKRI